MHKPKRGVKHITFMTEQAGDANCRSVCWQGPLKLPGEVKTGFVEGVAEHTYGLSSVSGFRLVGY